ncbi:hypothetical protein MNBD_PLANCTO02-2548 [hydrothermal vent metagenome]|uniref:Sulfatase N-terminal domain-containing protein n=1 Tax=hydrothermal vent metagenome TaxID=652676 RepID=A0A3B1DBE0_9ZZZZ
MICVVLAIENLPAFTLGCYGGTEFETPYFDLLSSAGVTFNWHFADSIASVNKHHPWMTGDHTFFYTPSDKSPLMKERLENAGVHVVIQNEELPVCQNSFSELITQATETLQQLISSTSNQPTLFWLNAQGVSGKTELKDEVKQLDTDARALIEFLLNANQAEEILFVMTAARGAVDLPQINALEKSPLPESLVHTPLIFVSPLLGSSERRQELVQTIDLLPTIEDWLTQQSARNQSDGKSLWQILKNETSKNKNWREAIYIKSSDNTFAVRTDRFYLIEDKATQEDAANSFFPNLFLYVKPDDLWDIYNVANQSPQVVEELHHQQQVFFSNVES